MKLNTKSPSYLIRNPHSYCFRLTVPKDLQKFVGKTELRYSLKTGYIGVAKQKARYLAGQVQYLFQYLREGGLALSGISDEKIQQMVNRYIKDQIADLERGYYDSDNPLYRSVQDFRHHVGSFDFYKERTVELLGVGDYRPVENQVANLLKDHGVHHIEKGSESYIKLCREIIKADLKLLDVEKKHLQGDYSYKEDFPELFPALFKQLPVTDTPTSLPLSKVIEDYRKEKVPTWKPRTVPEIDRALNHLQNYLGETTPVHSIDGKTMREYKQMLLVEEYKPGKTRSITTINDKYLCFVKALFTYAKDNHYIKDNPAEGISIKDSRKKKAHTKQDAFTREDLSKLFCESPEFGKDELEQPHYFWIPLIGLFTGMRLEEICQLYVSDLKQIDGIWCLDAFEEEEHPEKSIKTGERRTIPLHPFLVKELKFVSYVNSLPNQEGRIFPETNWVAKANRYGHHFSMWFSTFRKKCLPSVKPRKKTFHSLRHTLKTHLAEMGADVLYNHYLTGHATKDIGDDYIKPKPELIYEKAVMKIDWGLDFGHLKNSKFVPR
ncbi:tyrosine-type recombinase/integrase [bacterium]|nr:tyrosine-type recombinase/integrase [bacterium]